MNNLDYETNTWKNKKMTDNVDNSSIFSPNLLLQVKTFWNKYTINNKLIKVVSTIYNILKPIVIALLLPYIIVLTLAVLFVLALGLLGLFRFIENCLVYTAIEILILLGNLIY